MDRFQERSVIEPELAMHSLPASFALVATPSTHRIQLCRSPLPRRRQMKS